MLSARFHAGIILGEGTSQALRCPFLSYPKPLRTSELLQGGTLAFGAVRVYRWISCWCADIHVVTA